MEYLNNDEIWLNEKVSKRITNKTASFFRYDLIILQNAETQDQLN